MDPNGDAMVMCIDAIWKKPMSFNDQKPTTEVWQTEAMYLNLSVEGDGFLRSTWKGPSKYPQNDKTTRIFLNFFTGSQPRGEVSLKFLTEEVMFFSYQHFDVTKWLKVRNEIPVDDMISGLSDLDNLDSWKPK